MPTKTKSLRRFRAVSVTLDPEMIPKIQDEALRLDITVSQFFRRIAKNYLNTGSVHGTDTPKKAA